MTREQALFKFELDQIVQVTGTQQTGVIVSQARYFDGPAQEYMVRTRAADGTVVTRISSADTTPSYLVHSTCEDGRVDRSWWIEYALSPVEQKAHA